MVDITLTEAPHARGIELWGEFTLAGKRHGYSLLYDDITPDNKQAVMQQARASMTAELNEYAEDLILNGELPTISAGITQKSS